MTRIRRRINAALPKYVYRRKYGFIYRPYLGMMKGVRQYGKEVNLCPPTATVAEIWESYERETAQERDTLRWLLSEYHNSDRFRPGKRALKPRTAKDYQSYRATLLAYPTATGQPFGDALLTGIKRTTIRRFLDKHPSPIAANRLIQYLKAAWNHVGQRWDHIPDNPCAGVTLNEQAARERYITPQEYAAIHQCAAGWVYWAMELAYLCRARRSEILALKVSDITEDGLRLERGKGSLGEITAWTPRLRRAVNGALTHSYGATSPIASATLLLNNRGRKITDSAWNSALQRLRPKMMELGIEAFTLHDLKAAGYSDQAEQFAGHKSEKMDKVYNRKLRIVRPAE